MYVYVGVRISFFKDKQTLIGEHYYDYYMYIYIDR